MKPAPVEILGEAGFASLLPEARFSLPGPCGAVGGAVVPTGELWRAVFSATGQPPQFQKE